MRYKSKLAAIVIFISLIIPLMAGTCGGTTPPTIKPEILSLSPKNNEKGVNENAKITINFSEAMDQAATQAAFNSSDIGAVTFSWTNAGKTMIVKPNHKLKYSSSTAYKYYHYSISTTARDLAGNLLKQAKAVKFSTYRTFYKKLYSQKAIDGYVYNNATIFNNKWVIIGDISNNNYRRGFLSFDISSLPSNIYKIKSAAVAAFQYKIKGTPYKDLTGCSSPGHCKYLLIYHMDIGSSLDAGDFGKNPISQVPINFSNDINQDWKKVGVTAWVQDDWKHRVVRHNRSQYRLQFYKNSDNDGSTDSTYFLSADNLTSKPYLQILYYAP